MKIKVGKFLIESLDDKTIQILIEKEIELFGKGIFQILK